MKFLNKVNWKDVGERALKTFIEAFVAAVAAGDILNMTEGTTFKSAVVTTLIAGLAAGVSAVWNMLANALQKEASN